MAKENSQFEKWLEHARPRDVFPYGEGGAVEEYLRTRQDEKSYETLALPDGAAAAAAAGDVFVSWKRVPTGKLNRRGEPYVTSVPHIVRMGTRARAFIRSATADIEAKPVSLRSKRA